MKKKRLILAVDDNPQNLQFLGKLLSDSGFEVAVAQSGQQALNFIRKTNPI
jgi:CheY-like chemotaxis protein